MGIRNNNHPYHTMIEQVKSYKISNNVYKVGIQAEVVSGSNNMHVQQQTHKSYRWCDDHGEENKNAYMMMIRTAEINPARIRVCILMICLAFL